MFSWFKRPSAPPPPISKSNPGKGAELSVAFSRAGRTWSEKANAVNCLSEALAAGGHPHKTNKSWVELNSGFVLQPNFVSFKPLENGGVQTSTTLEIYHPEGVPPGVFEYQYSTGDDLVQSARKGFSDWMKLDLPAFLDAQQIKPKECPFLEMDFPATETSEARKRRIVLGPVSHYAAQPAPPLQPGDDGEHSFCPCCLFTRSISAMKPVVEDGGFYGIRLLAIRSADGSTSADCRLNGEEWEEGKAALREYIETWPNRGFEFRKQYVIAQTKPV